MHIHNDPIKTFFNWIQIQQRFPGYTMEKNVLYTFVMSKNALDNDGSRQVRISGSHTVYNN